MENSLEEQIRLMLVDWREDAVLRLGFHPDQIDYCARYSMVMHDVFIDAIARAAPYMRSINDFYTVARYWKWIDQFGTEIYQLIQSELNVSKRLSAQNEYSTRKRVRCC